MAPRLNGSDTFSACSIAQMQPTVNNASCMSTYDPPDVSLEVTTPAPQATVGTSFTISYVVRATGDDVSQGVSTTATIPTGLTVGSATAEGVACTSGAGNVNCVFGTMAPGDAHQIDIQLTPTATGTLQVNLALGSTNDANDSNNTGDVIITSAGIGAPPPPPPSPTPPSGGGGPTGSASGGGGGGSVDVTTLVAMLGAALLALRRRARVRAI